MRTKKIGLMLSVLIFSKDPALLFEIIIWFPHRLLDI